MALNCINRNIVECKAHILIYIYNHTHSINRNIVECKVHIPRSFSGALSVLIETQWNVKHIYAYITPSEIMVLIETQWNVKTDNMLVKAQALGINRNIVECKDDCKCFGYCCVIGINRNIVECKVFKHAIGNSAEGCINRNIVECKVVMAFHKG